MLQVKLNKLFQYHMNKVVKKYQYKRFYIKIIGKFKL